MKILAPAVDKAAASRRRVSSSLSIREATDFEGRPTTHHLVASANALAHVKAAAHEAWRADRGKRSTSSRGSKLLNQVIRAYQEILLTVEGKLAGMGLAATSRVKTRDVLIDKLRREHRMALARVQDLAGARIVIEGGRMEQDALAERIVEEFDPWTGNASKLMDRRENPSHGYRAVHVIVFPEKIPVEIQIRTELQNYWAQIIESLADRWGRGIRYGHPQMSPTSLPKELSFATGPNSPAKQCWPTCKIWVNQSP